MVVLYSNLSTCDHCSKTWNYALCDGGANHSDADCQLKKSHPMAEFARKNRLVMLYLRNTRNGSLPSEVAKNFVSSFKVPNYPAMVVLAATAATDCDTPGARIMTSGNGLELIGLFPLSPGKEVSTANGSVTFGSSWTDRKSVV